MLRLLRRRPAGLAFAAGLAAGLGGCSVLSLDGLTGGDAGVGATGLPDGSIPGDDAGDGVAEDGSVRGSGDGSDDAHAGRDGSAADAGGPPEAGSETGAPAEGGPLDASTLGFCASQNPAPLFCDDFDEGANDPAWDQVTMLGGSVAVTGGKFVSAPDSMVSAVDANTNAGSVDLAGYKSLTSKQGASGTATLGFDLLIAGGDTTSAADAVLGAIQLWNGSALYDLELEVKYASPTTYAAYLTEDSPSVPHATGFTIALGKWTRVTLAVVLPAGSGGSTTASLTLGGSSVLSTTVHVLGSGAAIPSPIPEALVGPTFATPAAGGWAVRYDNVTFDVR